MRFVRGDPSRGTGDQHMPNAVPSVAAAQLPAARMIDPRGHRFGAATSSLILIGSFVAGWIPGVEPLTR